ncbi:DUF4252 domain-containing protein [uncultured Sunxiuqinia sp.]|uniref:DUF4252 domain-containing protein n=1 Tax=uncultured Sunxiuqinia sp. TaxID=1573825 RepID=UPI002AA90A2A|nr:DUF4252 domain-containing protein [uncultured Sunxiuqinia sp.]
MKQFKIILVLLFLVSTGVVLGQSKSDKIFDSFRNKPGVTYFAFTKSMTDAFNIDLDEGKTIKGDLNEIRFMSYNPTKGSLSGTEFIKKASRMLPSAYNRVVEVDDDNDAEIWMLGNKRKAKEFHIFIKNEEEDDMQFLISFFGNFDIDDIEGIQEIGLNMTIGD